MLSRIWRQWRRWNERIASRRGRSPQAGRTLLCLERLETRDLLTTFNPFYLIGQPAGASQPMSTPGPTGYSPSQVQQAYGFNQINFAGVAGNGSGQTIAIVDAYDDPNIASDLRQFDRAFGLPDPTFTKVNQNGGSTMPAANSGWANEIALDVEWAHAIAPGANILLVEANSSSDNDLFSAVQFAAAQPGVSTVSMSWGGGEFSSESSLDSVFVTPAGHQGVTFIASSGDAGAPVSYPAVSPNVLAVGGTSLFLDGSNNYSGESAWSGSGGGISAYESQPSYQAGIVTQSTTQRTSPDVAYDADPNTGVSVYNSYSFGAAAPWAQFGGTSAAAPQWAALVAIADQGRALNGEATLDGPSQLLPDIYQLPSSDFHDTTSGASTGSPNYPATPGYDLVTGRGTPFANLVVAGLVGTPSLVGATHFSVTTDSGVTAGAPLIVTVSALDANNIPVAGYTGTVHFTSSDPSALLPSDYTFGPADNGTRAFSAALLSAGTQTITAQDVSNNSVTGSASVAVTPAASNYLVFAQQPTNAAVGATISPAVTVSVFDQYGNLVSNDNSDQVTLSLGNNPGNATLGGTTTVTVSNGVATFSDLSLDQIGNGYTLTASSGNLTGASSVNFNIASNSSRVIEDFESGASYSVAGGNVSASRSTAAAHDGNYGLAMGSNYGWIYRDDSAAQVKAGDTVSVWVQLSSAADGRAYFGFGASSSGTLSLVAAPNSNQLILQRNNGYGFSNLAVVNQTYQANHWYRLEVDWGTSGQIVGNLYDSDGTTLLGTVSATTTAITSGGIAFRATGRTKYFDTVTDTPGVNSFATPAPTGAHSAQTVAATQAERLASIDRHFAAHAGSPSDEILALASLIVPGASAQSSAPASEEPRAATIAAVDRYFASLSAATGYSLSSKARTTSLWFDRGE